MKRALAISALLILCATSAFTQYAGPWTQEWGFDEGLQGWVQTQGGGYWIDPAAMPNGPTLPDGGASGAGGGNVYAPDASRFQMTITPTRSFVIQARAYLPNLMPLIINDYLPGNGLQNAGIGAITTDGKLMYTAGKDTNGVKIGNRSWDGIEHSRSWLMEEAGVTKEDMWDDWVTLQFVYNLNNSGKYTGYVYTPWDSGVHDGPGWYAFAEYDIRPEPDWQYVDRLIFGSVTNSNSWTQAQFDDFKFYTVPEPGCLAMLGAGLAGMTGIAVRRRR